MNYHIIGSVLFIENDKDTFMIKELMLKYNKGSINNTNFELFVIDDLVNKKEKIDIKNALIDKNIINFDIIKTTKNYDEINFTEIHHVWFTFYTSVIIGMSRTNNDYYERFSRKVIKNLLKKLVVSIKDLKSITFNEHFDLSISNKLSEKIKILIFGFHFNKNVDYLPNSVVYLLLGIGCKQLLSNVPNNILYLNIKHYKKPIKRLPYNTRAINLLKIKSNMIKLNNKYNKNTKIF